MQDSNSLEFQMFKGPMLSMFYIVSALVFMTRYCPGCEKVTRVLGILKGRIGKRR